ncbi:MAG: hypothetical protein PHT84_04520 [Candidatus Pacebacteria bacterium]|nr:hypothetical protein [Candidatus Paceibacterota bacterium]
MLNDEDILKLKSVFTTKDDILEMKDGVLDVKGDIGFMKNDILEMKDGVLDVKGDIGFMKNDILEVKSDMADLKELVQGLIVSSDNIAKSIGNLSVEYAAISSQLSRHDAWIKQIAEKVGLKLATD